MTRVSVKCPMDGTVHQQFCGLVEHYKQTGTTHECHYQHECSEIRNTLTTDTQILEEIINEIK